MNKFYKAYVELRNKVPTSKRKSRVINPKWDEVGAYLADNYVLFDIDDKDTNANLFFDLVSTHNLHCHITESEHGIHAIFKKPAERLAYGNRKETLTGILADYKCSNNKGYERIIINKEPLPIVYNCDEPDVLPWFLYPFGRPRNLQDMEHGASRHTTFLDLSNVYAIYENDPQKILDMIHWVNDNVFAVARESVNVRICDVMDSIQFMKQQYTDIEICDIIKNVDKSKLLKLLVQYDLLDVSTLHFKNNGGI